MSKQLIVSLEEEMIEVLEELRKRKWKLSKQEVVRDAVGEYIEREAKKYGLIAGRGLPMQGSSGSNGKDEVESKKEKTKDNGMPKAEPEEGFK